MVAGRHLLLHQTRRRANVLGLVVEGYFLEGFVPFLEAELNVVAMVGKRLCRRLTLTVFSLEPVT